MLDGTVMARAYAHAYSLLSSPPVSVVLFSVEMANVCYSIVYCDATTSEKHYSELTGQMAPTGYSAEALRAIANTVTDYSLEIVELTPYCQASGAADACLLVVRNNGKNTTLATLADQCLQEAKSIQYDTWLWARGKLVNAHGRHHVSVAPVAAAGDPATGKHTTLAWSEVPVLQHMLNDLKRAFLPDREHCDHASVVRYPDIVKGGIGWHGDGERKRTTVQRLGDNSSRRPLAFQWYLRFEPVSDPISVNLNHGDLVIYSEKAVGTDWKSSSFPTLRHATGFLKQGATPIPTAKAAKRKLAEKAATAAAEGAAKVAKSEEA